MVFRFLIASLVALAFSGVTLPAYAVETHGLAMHGAPKYSADFKHLDYANPQAPKGGHLKMGAAGSFDTLNHHIIMGNTAEGLALINDKLMERVWDEPFTLYGLVAEKIDIPEDRSSVTFYLRPEARFHDGHPMTAEDVVFSHKAYLEHGHPVRRRVYGLVEDVKILDDHTVRFEFGEGYDAETALILAMMPVLPKHYWEKHDISKTTLTPPLGSGPYKITEVDPGRKIVYERVRDYWAQDIPVRVGHYNFDTITYQYYRDDDVVLQSFKAGDYDLRREWDINKWQTGYDAPAVKSGDIILEEIAHGRPEWLRALVYNTRRDLFADRRVREALSYAFDFEWLNKTLFHSGFNRIESTFPNSSLAATGKPEGEELEMLEKYRAHLPKEVFGEMWSAPDTNGGGPAGLRQNLLKATKLLKEAGWAYRDGVLVNQATGKPFAFEILVGNPNYERIALEFARTLKRLGITARVRIVDSAQYTGRLNDFDFDMTVFQWVNSLSPGNEQMNYWGSDAAHSAGSRNYAGVDNPAIDALADSIARAPTRESLVARAKALDRALMWGYYFIPLYYQGKDRVAYDSKLQRPEKTPVYGIVWETWWQE